MATLKRVVDSPARLHLSHSPVGGWVLAALGAAGLAASWSLLDGGARVGALALSGLFLLAGVASGLKRLELTFDFDRQRFGYRRGSVFGGESGEEPLDMVERVILKRDIDRRGGRNAVDEWEVKLEVRGWSRPVEVFESKSESEARAQAEELARRLDVPLGERTER